MENTVIAVYDSYAQAEGAMNELLSAGFSRNDIHLDAQSERSTAGTTTSQDNEQSSGSAAAC